MNCIRCDGTLRDANPPENQPINGTEFSSYGHYGSAVTDHMDGTKYIINVCDACVLDALATGTCKASAPDAFKPQGGE